jgi:formylglycine-generating enzyme required for sulfatase activity
MKRKEIIIGVIVLGIVGFGIWYFFWPKPHPNKERIEVLLEHFVTVDGGSFVMGSPDSIGSDDEIQHTVYVSTFKIQNTEVTQELYELVMAANPSENKAWKDMPVTNVSWEDCQEFIKKLNEITDLEYRLPTEAEWEYAARGGVRSMGYVYSGGTAIDDFGWHEGNAGETVHVVAEKKPNELGIYDMSGNVWEWCSDWYGPYRLDSKGSRDPQGPDNGQYRVLRGGSWSYNAYSCRTANRGRYYPGYRNSDGGFRLVLPAVR